MRFVGGSGDGSNRLRFRGKGASYGGARNTQEVHQISAFPKLLNSPWLLLALSHDEKQGGGYVEFPALDSSESSREHPSTSAKLNTDKLTMNYLTDDLIRNDYSCPMILIYSGGNKPVLYYVLASCT